jgi:tetratricopeptide (TPR) repeat protein
MQAHWPRRLYPPLALAASGAAFALLAVADKVFGLVQRPLYLATLSYASLFSLVAWGFVRGIQVKPSRFVRLSVYAACLTLTILTAAYAFAWRVSADPTPVMLQTELSRGDALLVNGDKDGAHLVYLEAYRRFPNSFPVLWRLGAVNYQTGDYERAEKYFTRALEVAPRDQRWRALNDLGQTYWRLRRPEQAIDLYLQAEREGMPPSELLEWHYRLGWAYFDVRDYDAAIHHYSIVAQQGETYAAASYYNIACAQAQKLNHVTDPHEREALIREGVENLRSAWKATTSGEEKETLLRGLSGGDPELAPLSKSPSYVAFLQEISRDRPNSSGQS